MRAVIIKHSRESGPPPRMLQKKMIIKELIELEGMVLQSTPPLYLNCRNSLLPSRTHHWYTLRTKESLVLARTSLFPTANRARHELFKSAPSEPFSRARTPLLILLA